MSTTVMISIEGVLCKGRMPNGQPLDVGIELVFGLKQAMKVVLSTLCDDDAWVEHWLHMNALQETHYLKREAMDGALTDTELRLRHVRAFRGQGWQLGLVVDHDAFVCSEITRMGVSSMCFTDARHGQIQAPKAWAEIEKAATEQRRLSPPTPVTTADIG